MKEIKVGIALMTVATLLLGNGAPDEGTLNSDETTRIKGTLGSVATTTSGEAQTETVDGIEWTFVVENGEASVGTSDYWGESAIPRSTIGAITIPSTLGGCPVTSIGDWAFYDCNGLTAVTIPSIVTSIGEYAFFFCEALTTVTIPSSVTSIGDYAFVYCYGLTSVTIPSSVTSIGDSAFYSCSGLTAVTIPSSVTSIGDLAFWGCSGIRDVTIPACVTSLFETFPEASDCITNVVICEGTSEVGSGMFYYYTSLMTVTIPSSVTNIGDYAFCQCYGLTTVTIPSGVTSIGYSAFAHCSGLTTVTIPSSVTSIGECAFEGCNGLTAVTISDGVTSIGHGAFSCCSGLTTVTIPSSVTSIGDYAFSYCSGLTELIVDSANENYVSCDGVLYNKGMTEILLCPAGKTTVTIPSSVTSIGDEAFSGCSGLTEILVDSENKHYISHDGVLYDKSITKLLRCPEGKTAVTIPPSVTSIGEEAFEDCDGLTSVTIPSSVTSIGGWAFAWCSGLTSVTISEGVTSIGDSAFCYCRRLTKVTIPSSVTSIGDSAFEDCRGLTSVTIPSSVTSIGKWAFASCSGLTSVTIPSSVTSIGYSAFAHCSGLTTMTIPSSVTNIGDSAFFGCTGLGTGVVIVDGCVLTVNGECPSVVALPMGTRLIAGGAFDSCKNLTSVTIPSSVTSIGEDAFFWCEALTTVTIPSSVTSIGGWAFYSCTGLKNVTIPYGVTYIGEYAFESCRGLTNVVFGGNAPNAGAYSFSSVASGCTATVFEGTTGWGSSTTWKGLKLVYRAAIPDIGENPTKEQVAEALSGAADPKLAANVTSGADYVSFRAWALRVKNGEGAAAGGVAVMNAPRAWLSYALDSATLIAAAPQEGDVEIEAFEPTGDGSFAFTVGVKDVEVGASAAKENLKRVFGLEGGTSPDDLSTDGVDISFGVPEDGKVKFTAKPKDEDAQAFFMRVQMTP